MNKETVLIIGSSGHAKVVIDIFEKEGKYEIAGLIDDFRNIGEETLGYKIIGIESDLSDLHLKNPNWKLFIAIGDNWVRHNVVNRIIDKIPDIEFASAIHPSAQIAKGVKIGKGVAIMAGAIVNSNSTIGDFTIINTKASLDHDGEMLSFSSLAPNATCGGNVSIGAFSALSISATIKHGISIGSHTIIGAGSVLLKNCGDHLILYGCPAKEIRKREVGEKYL
jgi:sugar O-acyltransferase (sialic acid O-acetyltransferase NeuD family)